MTGEASHDLTRLLKKLLALKYPVWGLAEGVELVTVAGRAKGPQRVGSEVGILRMDRARQKRYEQTHESQETRPADHGIP